MVENCFFAIHEAPRCRSAPGEGTAIPVWLIWLMLIPVNNYTSTIAFASIALVLSPKAEVFEN